MHESVHVCTPLRLWNGAIKSALSFQLAHGRLRVYDLPAEVVEEPAKPGFAVDTLQSVLQVDEGETVYDYAWYPGMLVSEPASCVFACTARVSGVAPLSYICFPDSPVACHIP